MHQPQKKSRYLYSYDWAENVVQSFTEKLWRGTTVCARFLGMSRVGLRMQMIDCIRRADQERWRRMKILIKMLDDDAEMLNPMYSYMDKRKYLTYVKTLVEELAKDGKNPPAGY